MSADAWWLDEFTTFGSMIGIRDANRLLVAYALPEDARRIIRWSKRASEDRDDRDDDPADAEKCDGCGKAADELTERPDLPGVRVSADTFRSRRLCAGCHNWAEKDPIQGPMTAEEAARAENREREEAAEIASLRYIRALQGAPLEGCGDDDCDDCYPK